MNRTPQAAVLLLLGALILGGPSPANATPVKPVAKKVVKKAVYTCPMHPEVIAQKPGKCPKCGMFLEKKAK